MDGYLPDSESRMGPYLDARGVELHALAEVPCLILLGIPGMGKTSELEAAADTAKQADELVRLYYPSSTYRPLRASI